MRKIAMQSKEWIAESFFDLLSVKPLNSITISEITENAELDRRTFYRHFKTKEDVISYYIHEAAEQGVATHYGEAMQQNSALDNFAIAKTFFEICFNIKDMLMILYKQNLLHLFLVELNIFMPKYHYQFTVPEKLQVKNGDYILAYNIGGFWNLLIKWLANDCKKTPEQMAEIVVQVFSAPQI